MRKAVFVDKDGTLIHDVPYNVDTRLITWQEGAIGSLKFLQELGYLLIVISNQAGIAHGFFDNDTMNEVRKKMEQDLADASVKLNGFYFCPHHPYGSVKEYSIACSCRKPQPGLILKAARDLNVDLSQSWMVGDILNDVEAGSRAGCRTILIDNGNETEWQMHGLRSPTFIVNSINEAVERIFAISEAYVRS